MATGLNSSQRYNLPALRRVATMTYSSFQEIPSWFQLGISERQLAWRMGRVLAAHGSEQRAFPVIVAFGSNAATPHHIPTSRRLQPGDIIKIDAGAVYQYMRGDVTRTWFIGTPDKKFLQRYMAVYTAQAKAFPYFQVGNSGQLVDSIARDYLWDQGLGKLFIHSLGHGVGRAIHQPPLMTPGPKGRRLIQIGEVITNEPGVYEPGWGGIRIEDMLEITAAGPKWLGEAPRQLRDIVLPADRLTHKL